MTLTEKLTNAFNELDDDDKLQLWNDYCEENNMMDDQAIPVDQIEELYPLQSFDGVHDVINKYSGITNDAGQFNCELATLDGYGHLKPFNVDYDIDVDAVVNDIADGNLYRVLPDELQEVMDEEEEEA